MFSFIFSSILFINLLPKNQILIDNNLFNEEITKNPKVASIIGTDWEIGRGSGQIAIINKPNQTQEGDLLILHCTIDGQADTMTSPIGWNVLLPENNSVDPTTASWYKIAGDSEPISYNVTWGTTEGYVAGIIRITEHDKTDPIQATATASGAGNVVNPSVNITKNYTLIIGFHGLDREGPGDDYNSTFLETGPTVLYAKAAGAGNQGCSAGLYYEIQANQGISPNRTWSIGGSEDWYAATVAINLNLPIIDIMSPLENETYGVISPNFTVEITDPNLNTTWYTVDGGINNYTFTENGTIHQAAWSSLPDGIVPIRFYANNSLGNLNFEEVNVIKDSSVPILNIISPLLNEAFGVAAPNFTIEITDPNLNTTWYTVDGGISKYTFTENGTIIQAAWDSLPDGIVTIRFFANNSLGNINFEEVNVTKDSSGPVISIISPLLNEMFGVAAPNFTVEIKDSNLDTKWYLISNITYQSINVTFTDNGTIDSTEWGFLYDGTYTIRFYSNDTLGNINFEEVNVTKDSSAPIVNIIIPVMNEEFGVDAPNFTVEITDPNLNITWYTVDGGFNNYTFTENGTLHQATWNSLPDGIVTIRFYANDSLGNLNFEDVNVTKDSSAPLIAIISPVVNEEFGVDAPNFIVENTDPYLNTTWYTVDGGLNNYTFTENGTIHQAAWNSLPDGIVTIRFYANDSLGNLNFEDVNVTKDGSAPIVNIISPLLNDVFGVVAPNFSVEITDPNLNITWYTVDGGLNNYTFTENGTIHQAAWNSLPDGIVSIRFYANDTLGNINFEDVNITKDSSAPIVNIISPIMDKAFGVDAPNFTVEITDTNLNITWYTVDGGFNNYTFTENGTILQAAWDSLPDGIVTIRFYANDTLGNINFEGVSVIKDSLAPILSIISPIENEIFGVDAPNFIVEITGTNLNTTWFTVDGGLNNYTFTENGTIHQAAWDSLPDGIVTIRFYANDSVGNINFEEVNVTKDSSAPIVNIISPIMDEVFGVDAPNFIVEITDTNLNITWYTMDGGLNNYTFTENGTIHQTAWDSLPDGIVTIRFYANDTLGNLNFQQVNIIKDSSAPIISIISPIENEIFGVDAPNFIVEIIDANLNITWYTMNGGFNNYTFTENGTIYQATWDSLPDGIVSIRFYANDSLGNINFKDVNIIKDSSAPIVSILSPIENEIFGVDAPNFIVEIAGTNLNTTWYTVDGGINNYTFTENGTIHQTAWETLPDGIITIRFYANDSVGNINFKEVNVIKDGSAPIIIIINPIMDEVFGVDSPSFIVEITDTNLNATWYTMDGGFNNYTFTENETLHQAAWGSFPDGIITIRFYANDSLGNINFKDVNVIKDSSAPIVNIINPLFNKAFGVDAPNFIVEITDMNLNVTWYTMDGGFNNYTFTENGTLHQAAWDSFPDGIISIRFYANDTVGNINFEDIDVTKDGSAPIISIISPVVNGAFGVNAPNFTVEIKDTNLNTTWYTVDGGFNNYTFTENETLHQAAWGSFPDGIITIRFYANDSLGNINFEDVNITKDGSAPIISIIGPIADQAFGVDAPNFIVEIADPNLNTTWYTMNEGLNNYTFTENETLHQAAWGSFPDGIITIRFYANDSLGNLNFEDVNVTKDGSAPNISIISPIVNGAFGVNAPNFTVEITDASLNTTWYTMDGGFNNYIFTENGTIHQTAWDALPDGIVTIRFFANNSLGNLNFEEVNIIKDGSAPIISIISPIVNGAFGVNAPNFTIEIADPNLNTTWYTVDGGINNYTFTENGTIHQAAWDSLSEGVVTIRFYSNDTLGNINFEEVNVIKDGSAPIISIISPITDQTFGVNAPNFTVEITDANLDTMWYTVNNSATKFIFTQDGVIDQTIWDAQTNGDVILIFYANDTAGNLASKSIIIIKNALSEPNPDIIPFIILFSVIGGIIAAIVVLGFLIIKGKISFGKLSIEKPSIEIAPKERTLSIEIFIEETPSEKTQTEETQTEETQTEETQTEETQTEETQTEEIQTEEIQTEETSYE